MVQNSIVECPEANVTEREAPERPAGDRSLARKREILAAASRVFRRRGLQATGMREIAAELGMAVGNLYYYFTDKEDLLAFVQEEALAALLGIAAEIRALEEPPRRKLLRLLTEHVIRLNDPDEGTPGSLAHLEVEALGERRRKAVLARRDAYERTLRDLIEEGIAAGELRATDSRVAALVVLGALNWTVKWFRPDGPKSARTIGREAAEMLVRGLLASGVGL